MPDVPFDESDFQAEHDMRTLMEADEIRRDAPRLQRAENKARQAKKAMDRLTGDKEEASGQMREGFRRL